MTWTDITKNLTPEQVRTMERGVKKTGVGSWKGGTESKDNPERDNRPLQ